MLKPNNRVKWGNVILGTANEDIYVGLQPTAFISFARTFNSSLFFYEADISLKWSRVFALV